MSLTRRTFLAGMALAPFAAAAPAVPGKPTRPRAVASASTAVASNAPPLVIAGGRVLLPGAVWTDDATVVLEGGRVTAAGKGIAAPAGARTIDARGKWVTPGLIDASTHVGMLDVELEPSANDVNRAGDPLQPAFRAVDAYDPASELVAVARQGGVTTVIVAPGEGVLQGRSAVVDLLAGGTRADAVVRADLAAHLAVDDAAARSLGGSRASLWMHLREAFEDARAFAARRAAWEDNRARPFKLGRAQLEALAPVLRKEQPLVVTAHRASDIEQTLRFAEAFDLRLVLAGATEAAPLAGELAKRGVPVIVHPSQDLPASFDALRVVPDLAARLRAAGVSIVISTFDAHQVRLLWQEAGAAVRAGLPHAEAMRAITEAPADAFGLAPRGRLAAGAVANVVAWSGDPLETSTRALSVIVRGRELPRRDRQSLLLERYRKVPIEAPPRAR